MLSDIVVNYCASVVYDKIKNAILIVIFCLITTTPSFALNKSEGMRFLMVTALEQYGQKLFDRGDYDEATAVFNRVLTYDAHQKQALEYLKEMGHSPEPSLPLVIDVSNPESLRQAIAAKKQLIAILQNQIMQMRSNIAVQSAEGLN